MNDKQQLAAMGEHLAEKQQPMCLQKRVEELEEKVRVMAELLRDARKYVTALGKPDDEVSAVQMTVSRIDALLAGQVPAPAAPEGWKLVPVEPTKEMREAFHEAHEEFESGDNWWLDCPDHQWSAMLAAAPSPHD